MAKFNETYLDLFDKQYHGELHGQDLDKFNHKLRNDPDFKEAFNVFQASISGIQAARKKALIERLEALEENATPSFKLVWLTIPAAAMIIFSLTWLFLDYYGNTDASHEVAVLEEQKAEETLLLDTVTVVVDSLAIDSAELQLAIEDISQNGLPPPPPPVLEKVTEEDDFAVVETEEEIVEELIKKDVLLTSAVATVYNYPVDAITATRSVSKNEVSEIAVLSKKDRRRARKEKKEEENNKALETTDSEDMENSVSPQTSKIKVEYWNSVVNFKGYSFSGRVLKLYGYSPSSIAIHSQGNINVLQMGNEYYALVGNGTSQAFSNPITKPAFIK